MAWQDEILKNTGVAVAGDTDPRRLWVPMQVQALVFGREGTAKFLDLTPNYENLQTNTYAAPLGHQLRREADNPPEPGIHLHWTLPAAFTHVRPTPSENGAAPELPRVPNRWLVIRLWEESRQLHHK